MLSVVSYSPLQYLILFGIKLVYHHIEIFLDHQQFLGFCWTDRVALLSISNFPFCISGLATGPYIFTKLMQPLVKHWWASPVKLLCI